MMKFPTVKVYIWHPAAYEGVTDEFIFDRIWRTAKEFKTSAVGHVSLFARSINKEEVYLSFWPDETMLNKAIKNREKAELRTFVRSFVPMKGKFLENLDQDIHDMRSEPDCEIELPYLWQTKVYESATKLKSKVNNYNLLFQNCSSVVAYALASGTLYPSHQSKSEDAKAYAKRCMEILKTVGIGLEYYQACRFGDMSAAQKVLYKEFSLIKTMLSLPEVTLGARTPKMIEEYVTRLNRLGSDVF